jgi:NB-ARC domain
MEFLPLDRMYQRVNITRTDSDTALFYDLMFLGEMVVKLVVSGTVAGIEDDADRSRYTQTHKLVRASGIGDWAASLDEMLVGPASQHLRADARVEQRELTMKIGPGTWQYDAAQKLHACLSLIDVNTENLPAKCDGRRWISDFAKLRNKTRGHGAFPGEVLSKLCPQLEESIRLFADNFSLFRRPWAYLHRNLSGKYRVTALTENDAFDYLKSAPAKHTTLSNGVYVMIGEPVKVELAESSADLVDFYLANGGFTDLRFEMLSYLSGSTIAADSKPYLTPAGLLPRSTTEGASTLDVEGACFTNLPPMQSEYIRRADLEGELIDKLHERDRYPIVTLHGRGGTGKTSLALTVLHDIANKELYPVIIWFSARDIDLMPEGAKPVKPNVFTAAEIATEYVRLTNPALLSLGKPRGQRALDYFAEALSKPDSSLGPTLFVLDNFETVRNPAEVFTWLDTHVRNPNKILITARHRDFKGDYPIEVAGMSESESDALVDAHAAYLGIQHMLTPRYRHELHRESGGHPYVIKVLLGEVAKAGKCVDIERIVAERGDILTALFERTFAALSPAGRRVFLTLCNWRSTVPLVALEAVLLRPNIERVDVEGAVEELVRLSFVDTTTSDKDRELFLSVPLTAAVFGEAKLKVSPMKAAIEADTALLHMFGAAQKTDVRHGVGPRIERLIRRIASQVLSGKQSLAQHLPMLEFVAAKHAPAWLLLSELHEELGDNEAATAAVRRYLETADGEASRNGWRRLAELCRSSTNLLGELQAIVEMASVNATPFEEVSNGASRINEIMRVTWLPFEVGEKDVLLRKIIATMEARIDQADSTDCSRLAWLYLHVGEESKARELVERGLRLDSNNWHCRKLAVHLGNAPLFSKGAGA